MAVKIYSSAIVGLSAELVEVEVDVAPSLPSFTIVGLPDKAVEEARERVRAAIKNSGLPFPRTKVTVNLAPADIKKEGPSYDLPIALAIIRATEPGMLPDTFPWERTVIIGELALNGVIRPVRGVLTIALAARKRGMTYCLVPEANAREAAHVDGMTVIPLRALAACVAHIADATRIAATTRVPLSFDTPDTPDNDFALIQGQDFAKRALEIAAAGGHHLAFQGPPGSGKTILARALPTILPPLSMDEALEVTQIHSITGSVPVEHGLMTVRPFRHPHHTASDVAIVGGGTVPRPGEVSLAHRGVLFMDEFPEFDCNVLEALRQPLEDGTVTVARAQGSVHFPAQFMLIAAQNPCPCGYRTDREKACICTPSMLLRYDKKISGPIMDRIDLFVEVPRMQIQVLSHAPVAEASRVKRARVTAARLRQRARWEGTRVRTNAEMRTPELRLIRTTDGARRFFDLAVTQHRLSGRAGARLLKVAQTIADLAGDDVITEDHLGEAVQYRKK